ncbi:hypothetical protein M5689_020115 [Euphorbia peplus]|nr:hypothetical protein M5689_020115 [Euphorbia peplus]
MNSLPSLLELHLPYCKLPFYNLTRLPSVNMSSSLLVLDLSFNYFEGPILNGLQNITSSFLMELDLSWNHFNYSIPNWFYDLTHLQLLNLQGNQLQGQISSSIGNLTSLISLDMSYNHGLEFEKGIPNSFKNLCPLRSLDLSRVKMNQKINDVLAIMTSGCVSDVLQSLEFINCQFSGHLTNDLSSLRNLTSFRIHANSISGPIPFSLGKMMSLVNLVLSSNNLNGSLPASFGNMKQSEEVDISDNKLEGEVSQLHFANLTRLTHFYASGNSIALRVGLDWVPPILNFDIYLYHLGMLDLDSQRGFVI